jgi:hypothetical protein
MARPTFTPTDAQREQVKILSACGVPQKNICQIVAGKNKPMDEKTLRKYFSFELDNGSVLANAKVAQSLFKKAIAGNVPSMIFWLKTRAGWRENAANGSENSESAPSVNVVFEVAPPVGEVRITRGTKQVKAE